MTCYVLCFLFKLHFTVTGDGRGCCSNVITSLPRVHGAKYCNDMSVFCPSVRWNFTNSLCMFPVAVARSSSDGVAVRYVLPVLWTTSTSYFHIMSRI